MAELLAIIDEQVDIIRKYGRRRTIVLEIGASAREMPEEVQALEERYALR